MTAHIVKQPILAPKHTAERERNDNGAFFLGDVSDTPLHISKKSTFLRDEGRGILLLTDHLPYRFNVGKDAVDAFRRMEDKDGNPKITQTVCQLLRYSVRYKDKIGIKCEHALRTFILDLDRNRLCRFGHRTQSRIICIRSECCDLFRRCKGKQDFIRAQSQRNDMVRPLSENNLRSIIIHTAIERILLCRHMRSAATACSKEKQYSGKEKCTEHPLRIHGCKSDVSYAAGQDCRTDWNNSYGSADCRARTSMYRTSPPYRSHSC